MQPNQESLAAHPIKIVSFINQLVQKIGALIAWINVALIGIILASIFMRYVMNQAMVTLEELTWYLYAVGIMFGLSYSMVKNTHIRVDIISMHFSPRFKAFIEIIGLTCLLLPFVWVIFDHSIAWVWQSYTIGETSSSPQGLPYRWLVKSVIPLSFFLLGLAAIARLIESVAILRYGSLTNLNNRSKT